MRIDGHSPSAYSQEAIRWMLTNKMKFSGNPLGIRERSELLKTYNRRKNPNSRAEKGGCG